MIPYWDSPSHMDLAWGGTPSEKELHHWQWLQPPGAGDSLGGDPDTCATVSSTPKSGHVAATIEPLSPDQAFQCTHLRGGRFLQDRAGMCPDQGKGVENKAPPFPSQHSTKDRSLVQEARSSPLLLPCPHFGAFLCSQSIAWTKSLSSSSVLKGQKQRLLSIGDAGADNPPPPPRRPAEVSLRDPLT